MMNPSHSFFSRHSFTIILLMVFFLPFIWAGQRRALESNRNDVKDWLPEEFPETAVHAWFQEHFPHEQFVLASWEGCTLDDPRLELFARKLDPPPEEMLAEGQTWPFKEVITGPRLLAELRAHNPNLSEAEAIDRLVGSLIGPDRNKTSLVVTLSPAAGGTQLRPTLARIRELAWESGIPAGPIERGGFFSSVTDLFRGRDVDDKFARNELRLGGPPVDNVAIDVEGERTLFRLAAFSGLVGLGISWLCLRSIRLTLIVLLSALLSAGTGLAIVFFSGSTMDAILLSMPSLVYVLAISGSIHIVNYYHDAIREGGLEGAPDRGLAHGWLPCTLAAVTTAIGMGSLYMSQVIPIQKFGIFSALGVLGTLLMIFFFLPALLHYFPSRRYAQQYGNRRGNDAHVTVFVRFWEMVGGFVTRRSKLVTALALAVMAFFAFGVSRIETSVKLMKMFSPDAQIIADYTWLEERLGPLVPMEIVLRFDNRRCRLNTTDRMRLVQEVAEAAESLRDVGGAISAATFGPPLDARVREPTIVERMIGIQNPERIRDQIVSDRLQTQRTALRDYLAIDYAPAEALTAATGGPDLAELEIEERAAQVLRTRGLDNVANLMRYGHPDRSLEQNLRTIRGLGEEGAADVVAAVDAWRADHGEELWRVSARVWALTDLDYAHFLDELEGAVEPVLAAHRAQGHEGLDVTYTGLVPLVYKTQHELMNGLYRSLGLAFGLIALVMMFVLKSPTAGAISMIPNMFPVMVIFGFMGWTGILVDVGSMMTASVALGIAVDNTIHYLTWFRHGLDLNLDRKEAAMLAYRRCANAMTQTTLIGGLGLAVFAFSTFTPTQRFGTLMLALLFAASVGDLIFLPALLVGPLGRVFRRGGIGSWLDSRAEATAASGDDESPPAREASAAGGGPARESHVRPPHRPHPAPEPARSAGDRR